MLSEGRCCGSASSVREPTFVGPPHRDPSCGTPGASARAKPLRRLPTSNPRVRLHLKPRQKGTEQLLAQYGDRLICVRYRYDVQLRKRFKTVEILVAELRVPFADVSVRDRVKQAGGTWSPQRRVWELRHDRAIALGLEDRIVPDAMSARDPSI